MTRDEMITKQTRAANVAAAAILTTMLESGGHAPRTILAIGCEERTGLVYSFIESLLCNGHLTQVQGGDLHLTEAGRAMAERINATLDRVK